MSRRVHYIHERPDWPKLNWDLDRLAIRLASVRHEQGRLLGRMESLGFDLRKEANLSVLQSDVVKSSAIEGETLDPLEVRSSLARRLGLDAGGTKKPSRDVEGIVEMMLDATQNFDEPLTRKRIFSWHGSLFPTGRSGMRSITVGAWRKSNADPMRVVSGPLGKETIHFEAPAASRLEFESRAFFDWFEGARDIDPVLKAGIAHLWFVTIHPFEDGNGRIARAIADLSLARADGSSNRFYSMSTQTAAERKQYYAELEAAQRGDLDVTDWLEWFIECLGRAIAGADRTLGLVLFKSRTWTRIAAHPLHDRQRRVLTKMLDGFLGHLTSSKYAKLAKCSSDTALRDIQVLLARGILVANSHGGRSTSYRLADEPE